MLSQDATVFENDVLIAAQNQEDMTITVNADGSVDAQNTETEKDAEGKVIVLAKGSKEKKDTVSVQIKAVDESSEEEDKTWDGAHVQLLDRHGNVVDEWDATKEAHEVTGLTPGETYTLTQPTTTSNVNESVVNINVGQAAIYAVIGFAIVFFVLLILNLFIRLQSVIIRGIENAASKPKKAEPAAAAAAAAAPAEDGKQVIPPGMKVADGSLGDVKLYDVDEPTAAMIMAILAEQLDAPLNELRFLSIKEVTK